MDLLYEMVKTEKYFFGPVKRQIFGDALRQTFYMISKLVICLWLSSVASYICVLFCARKPAQTQVVLLKIQKL